MAKCRIRCLECKKVFDSPVQFADAEAFDWSSLADNEVQCPFCRKFTGCNKENMLFVDKTDGFVGKDT